MTAEQATAGQHADSQSGMLGVTDAVDCWVNLNPAANRFKDTVGYLFKDSAGRTERGATPDEIVARMRSQGIAVGLLTIDLHDAHPALDALERHPEVLRGVLKVDPRRGAPEIRDLERFAKDHPIVGVKVSAHMTGLPYNDASYYALYYKCMELGFPVTANVGIPGPRHARGEPQNPIHLDDVCWFFPELVLVMTHGGEPWTYTCVKLMVKWPNLYMMTSAFAPRYYPPELVQYLNTRGREKVMFASDYPLIDFDRCRRELQQLPLRPGSVRPFLSDNARRVFKL